MDIMYQLILITPNKKERREQKKNLKKDKHLWPPLPTRAFQLPTNTTTWLRATARVTSPRRRLAGAAVSGRVETHLPTYLHEPHRRRRGSHGDGLDALAAQRPYQPPRRPPGEPPRPRRRPRRRRRLASGAARVAAS